MKNTTIKCPYCNSEEVVKRGTFETKAHGKQQRFFCKKCGKKFIVRTAFYRMRNSSHKITCALDLFYNGVSTRKVQQHFKAFYPHNSSHKSIYKWVVKYAQIIHKFTDGLKLSVGTEPFNIKNFEFRFLNIETEATTCIFGNYVSIHLIKDKPIVIIIRNKDIAQSYKNYFEFLWKQAKQ